MENRTFALIVGIVSMVLIFAMGFAFWWLSGDRQPVKHYVIFSDLPITGLSAESAVKYRGVDVGKVTQITLSDTEKNSILIDIEVLKKLHLSQQTYAELNMQGITGLAFINLNDETNNTTTLNSMDKIPLRTSGINKLIDAAPALVAKLDAVLSNTKELTNAANKLMADLDKKGLNNTIANVEIASRKFGPLIDNANNTLERVASIASEKNQAQLRETVASIKTSAEAIIPLSKSMIDTSLALTKTSNGFDETSSEIQALTRSLNNETLPLLNTFTQTATNTLQNADKVINLINDNPQSLILGKQPISPGPGETGFKARP